jgi:hypothetical protein
MSKLFPVEYLQEVQWSKDFVDVIDGDDRRWSREVEVVFRDPDTSKLYHFCYEQGLTEMQENEYPWGYNWGNEPEPRMFECEEVEEYIEVVEVKKYRPVGTDT